MSKAVKKGLLMAISMVSVLSLVLFPAVTIAGTMNNLEKIPQKDGVYDVPNHKGMKVRVFVHYPKMEAKSGSSVTCSSIDPASGSLVSAGGWHLPSTLKYTLNTSSVPRSVGGKNLGVIAENSFKVWTGAVGNKIAITQSGTSAGTKANSDDGINLIAWGVVPNNALAVTYAAYYADGTVAGVDTIMNSKLPWSWSYNPSGCNLNAYDVQNILTHEIGHWMGLNDHYTADYANNTMYGYGSTGEIKKDTLTAGDINGVSAIYQ